MQERPDLGETQQSHSQTRSLREKQHIYGIHEQTKGKTFFKLPHYSRERLHAFAHKTQRDPHWTDPARLPFSGLPNIPPVRKR